MDWCVFELSLLISGCGGVCVRLFCDGIFCRQCFVLEGCSGNLSVDIDEILVLNIT